MTFAASKFARFLPTATFAMAVEFLMGLSDSVICGHIIGEDGLSAINLMQPVFNVVSFFALLVGTGTCVLYAMEMGRFDRRRASEILTQGLWTTLAFGLLLVVALAVARNSATALFGVSGAVLAERGSTGSGSSRARFSSRSPSSSRACATQMATDGSARWRMSRSCSAIARFRCRSRCGTAMQAALSGRLPGI